MFKKKEYVTTQRLVNFWDSHMKGRINSIRKDLQEQVFNLQDEVTRLSKKISSQECDIASLMSENEELTEEINGIREAIGLDFDDTDGYTLPNAELTRKMERVELILNAKEYKVVKAIKRKDE